MQRSIPSNLSPLTLREQIQIKTSEEIELIKSSQYSIDFDNSVKKTFEFLDSLGQLIPNKNDKLSCEIFSQYVNRSIKIYEDIEEKHRSLSKTKRAQIQGFRTEYKSGFATQKSEKLINSSLRAIGISPNRASKLDFADKSKNISIFERQTEILKYAGLIKNITQGKELIGNELIRVLANHESINKIMAFFATNFQTITDIGESREFLPLEKILTLLSRKNNNEDIGDKFSYLQTNQEFIKSTIIGERSKNEINIFKFISNSSLNLKDTIEFIAKSKQNLEKLDETNKMKYWEIIALCGLESPEKLSEISKTLIDNIKDLAYITKQDRDKKFGFTPSNMANILCKKSSDASSNIILALRDAGEDLSMQNEKIKKLKIKELFFDIFLEIIEENPQENLKKFLELIKFLPSNISGELNVLNKIKDNVNQLSIEEITKDKVEEIFSTKPVVERISLSQFNAPALRASKETTSVEQTISSLTYGDLEELPIIQETEKILSNAVNLNLKTDSSFLDECESSPRQHPATNHNQSLLASAQIPALADASMQITSQKPRDDLTKKRSHNQISQLYLQKCHQTP